MKVTIFGDCVIQQSCVGLEHVAAFGLTNWLSIVSPITKNFKQIYNNLNSKNYKLTNYERRVWKYNCNKRVFDYLFFKKADYFIFDCNDNRKEVLVEQSSNCLNFITPNLWLDTSKQILDDVYNQSESYDIKQCYEIDFEYYKQAITIICDKILDVYQLDEIIYVKHRAVKCYYDNEGIHNFMVHDKDEFLNNNTLNYWDKIEEAIFDKMKGIHIIEFPSNVIVDKNHPLGLNPLHYQRQFYEYVKSALEIIFMKLDINLEKLYLFQLKETFSVRFELFYKDVETKKVLKDLRQGFNALYNCLDFKNYSHDNLSEIFKSISNFELYLDFLYKLQKCLLIFVSVKDTAGFYEDDKMLKKIKKLGFYNYPNLLWSTYIGISLNGYIVKDFSSLLESDQAPKTLTENIFFSNLSVLISSSPYILENESKIIINGYDYSKNLRGINIVIFDSINNKFVDSVSFDSHVNDNFSR